MIFFKVLDFYFVYVNKEWIKKNKKIIWVWFGVLKLIGKKKKEILFNDV